MRAGAAPSAPAPRSASRRSADRHRRGPEPHGAPLWEDGRAGRISNASRAAAGSGGPSALGALAAAGRLVGRPRPAGARQLRPRRPGWERLAARDERRRSGARGERRLRLGRAAGRGWGALGRTATAAGRGAGGGWELGTNGNCGWVERQGPRRARVRTRSSGNSVRLDPPWKGQVATTCRAQRLRDAVRLCHPYGGKLATASRPRSPGTAGVGAPPAGAHRPRPRQDTDAGATGPYPAAVDVRAAPTAGARPRPRQATKAGATAPYPAPVDVRAARRRRVNANEPPQWAARGEETGGDLLSQALASQVPSALWGLTALFGMGRGVSPTQ